jgi:hypothetical protein
MRKRHLRPVSPIAEPPAELVQYDPNEWPADDDLGAGGSPYCQWLAARRRWTDEHGAEAFGGPLTSLRTEHRARFGLYQGDGNEAL